MNLTIKPYCKINRSPTKSCSRKCPQGLQLLQVGPIGLLHALGFRGLGFRVLGQGLGALRYFGFQLYGSGLRIDGVGSWVLGLSASS